MKPKAFHGYIVSIITGVMVVGGIIISSPYQINQREVGVLTRNGVFKEIEEPGLHIKLPFIDSVYQYPTSIESINVENDSTKASDAQEIHADLTIWYQIPKESVKRIYYEYGNNYQEAIKKKFLNAFREEIGKSDVNNVISHQHIIEMNVRQSMIRELKESMGVDLNDMQIMNYGFSKAFSKAIDDNTSARAQGVQAKIARDTALVVAEKYQVEAKAKADAQRKAADGEAYSITALAQAEANKTRLNGQAMADSIRAQTEALKSSPEYVHYTAANKWDGKLPVNIGVGASSASIPMLNLKNIGEEK